MTARHWTALLNLAVALRLPEVVCEWVQERAWRRIVEECAE